MLLSYKDLTVYNKAFHLAFGIYKISREFPKYEQYSLTDQMRRSSRSVCANIGEAYRKRLFESCFVSKITDADMENTETQIWLDFALSFEYLDKAKYDELFAVSMEVGKLLNHMIRNPSKYRGKMQIRKK